MPIDKNWAQNCLRHQRNSCVVSLGSLALLNSDQVRALETSLVVLRPGQIVFNAEQHDRVGQRLEISLAQLPFDYLNARANYQVTLYEHWKYARRNLIKEGFEITKAYADATGQLAGLKSTPWFNFARVIRNCVSHDLHFRFNKWDLNTLPVSYMGAVINSSLQNQMMLDAHLDHFLAFTLHGEMESWINSH